MLFILEIGDSILIMVKGFSQDSTGRSMMESLKREPYMVKENCFLQMEILMREILLTISDKVKEFIKNIMEMFTRGIFTTTYLMELVSILGQQGNLFQENSLMDKWVKET